MQETRSLDVKLSNYDQHMTVFRRLGNFSSALASAYRIVQKIYINQTN
jgi:hypothetical protein